MTRAPLPQALLIIDLQEDFFADEKLARQRTILTNTCNDVVKKAHDAGVPVFEVRTVHAPDRSSWSLNMLSDDAGVAIESTEGAEPVRELIASRTTIVEKTRDSAFHGTTLAEKLDDRGITSIAICGVSTESCIALTASEAYARDLHVTLVGDALGSVDPEAHGHALDHLSRQYRQAIVAVANLQFEPRHDDMLD